MTRPTNFRRRKKLIQPRLQLRMIGCFLAISALGFFLEALLLGSKLSELATQMPTGGHLLEARIAPLVLETLVMSFLFLLPLTLSVGILVTFRVAGPAYRFEKYLRGVARGEVQGPCQIRKGDELQGLCDALNDAVQKLQRDRNEDLSDVEDREAA